MSEHQPAPLVSNPEDNIQLPEPFTNQPEENIKLPEPFTNQPVYNGQEPFQAHQVYNGQLQDPFQNQQLYNVQNQQINNGQLQEPFQNKQAYNGKLEEPLTNTPEDQQRNLNVRRRQPIKKRYCLYVCAIIILCIEIFMNFCYYLSDSFSNGMFYRPDKEVEKRLDKMEAFIPASFIPCIMLSISQIYCNPKKTLIAIVILLIIKIGVFIGYFIILYSGKVVRLVALIPEIAFDAMILINEILKFNDFNNRNKNNN